MSVQSRRLPPTIEYGNFHIIKKNGCRLAFDYLKYVFCQVGLKWATAVNASKLRQSKRTPCILLKVLNNVVWLSPWDIGTLSGCSTLLRSRRLPTIIVYVARLSTI